MSQNIIPNYSAPNPFSSIPLIGSGTPGDYTADDNILNSDAKINGQYLVDWMDTEYVYDSGLVTLPVTSGTGVVTVQKHQPIGFKIVRWEKVRLETPPFYPSADTDDANLILLHKNIQTCSPGVMTNMRSRIFAARGVYVYGLVEPVQDGDELPLGIMACEKLPESASFTTQEQIPNELSIPAANAIQLF